MRVGPDYLAAAHNRHPLRLRLARIKEIMLRQSPPGQHRRSIGLRNEGTAEGNQGRHEQGRTGCGTNDGVFHRNLDDISDTFMPQQRWGRRFRLPTFQARIKSWQAKTPSPPFFMKFRGRNAHPNRHRPFRFLSSIPSATCASSPPKPSCSNASVRLGAILTVSGGRVGRHPILTASVASSEKVQVVSVCAG